MVESFEHAGICWCRPEESRDTCSIPGAFYVFLMCQSLAAATSSPKALKMPNRATPGLLLDRAAGLRPALYATSKAGQTA